jgi:ABC-2 type transport system ATP-binding protein
MVTHVGIINKGEILFQGTLTELHEQQTKTSSIIFETNDSEKTSKILQSKGLVVTVKNELVMIPFIDREVIAEIVSELVHAKIEVYQVSTLKNDLESIFIDLTKN